MVLKSPVVQPTRQRRVLSDALCHVGLEDQKPAEDAGAGGGCLDAQHLSRRGRVRASCRTETLSGDLCMPKSE